MRQQKSQNTEANISITKPADLIAAGTSYTLTQDITLYAVYSYTEATGESGTSDYAKVKAACEDWIGDYVIAYEASDYLFDSSLVLLIRQTTTSRYPPLQENVLKRSMQIPIRLPWQK